MFYKGYSIRKIDDKFEILNLETGRRIWRNTERQAKWAISVFSNIQKQMQGLA